VLFCSGYKKQENMSDSGTKNYIVWARKWRPKTFEEVIGQEHVTRTLVNALEQNRLGHAFIFAGPRGVGKTSTARLLAKAVNGIAPEDTSSTLDIIEIDGASNRGIDEIRNLRENIRFAPVSSSHKIYIIDEVHMLSKEAFNALLKTLEEPPSHAIFIFATTEIHKVPLTILSRCQRFDFKRIPTRLIAEQLGKIASAEKIEIDQDSLMLIARKSDGGMRDATSIMDQLASFSDGKVTIQNVQQSLGVINEELYFRFTRLIQQKDGGAVIHFAQDLFETGHDLLNFLQGLGEHFRNLLVVAATGNATLLEISDHYKDQYLADAKSFDEGDLLQYLDLLTTSESMLKFSENPRLVIELLLLKIAHKPKVPDLEELMKLLKNAPNTAAAQKKTEITPATAPIVQKTKASEPIQPPSPVVPEEQVSNSGLPLTPDINVHPAPSEKTLPTAPQINGSSAAEEPVKTTHEQSPTAKVTPSLPKEPSTPAANKAEQQTLVSEEVFLPPAPKINAPVIQQKENASPKIEPLAFKPSTPNGNVATESVATQTDAPPQPKAAPQPQPVSKNSDDTSFDTIKARWVDIVDEVRKEKIALGSFLQDGVPFKIENNQLQVAFDPKTEFHLEHVQKNADAVERALNTLFGSSLKLLCVKQSFAEAGLIKEIKSPQEILQSIKDKDEVLKKIIDTFDCEDIE